MGDMPTRIAYHLDKHFMEELMKTPKKEEDLWALCCGTTGRYPEITIPYEVIKDYIQEVVPSLMSDHNLSADQILNEAFNETPAPSMSM